MGYKMDNNFWVKTTNYKILGKILFSKEEICSDMSYQGEIYKINVTQDYYNSEFDINKKRSNDGG